MDKSELKSILQANEGRKRSMYLDSRGNVTVGVGHLLATEVDAQVLPFKYLPSPEAVLTPGDIADEWEAIKAGKRRATLFLPESEIDELLDADIEEVEEALSGYFGGDWEHRYPWPAKSAMLDMAFNLGVRGLLNGYPKMLKAATALQWDACAAECSRNGVADSRNEWTQKMFLASDVGGPV